MNNKDLPPEAVEIVEKNIRSLSEELKKNPDQLDQWLDLGIQRKVAGIMKVREMRGCMQHSFVHWEVLHFRTSATFTATTYTTTQKRSRIF